MSHQQRSQEFVDLVIASQRPLYGYILTLLPDVEQATEVLQTTNLVLWRDSNRFALGTNFLAWACRVAYFQVLDHRERTGRDRLRFDPELLEDLAQETVEDSLEDERRAVALQNCLKQLPRRSRQLIESRYSLEESVQAIAATTGRTAGAVANSLFRIRRKLLECIEQQVAIGQPHE